MPFRYTFLFIVVLTTFGTSPSEAFRDDMYKVPNGDRFNCNLCHSNPTPVPGEFGFPLNPFGRDYGAVRSQPKWNSTLAQKDSDGDGYTNGEELQEPTGDIFNWEPRSIGFEVWDLTAGTPTLARNPGDSDLSVPQVRFDPIRPSEYTLNVGDTLNVTLSGRVTVPGRTLTFTLSTELEGARIADSLFTWTPTRSQGGDQNIGIQASDGTSIVARVIEVKVLGGDAPPSGPDEPVERVQVTVSDFTVANFDFDGSLIVDLTDFTRFSAAYGTAVTQFDFDKNGRVGFRDFLFFAWFFNQRVDNTVFIATPARDQIPFVPVEGGRSVQLIGDLFQQISVGKHLIGKFEITNRQYRNYYNTNSRLPEITPFPLNRISFEDRALLQPDHPVVGVSQTQAEAYCKWIDTRLPLFKEWSFAARGTGLRSYAYGDFLETDRANYLENGDPFEPGTTPAGYFDGRLHQGFQTRDSFSLYGAYDMTGNVWEWCADTREDITPNQAPIAGGSYLEPAFSNNLKLGTASWIPVTEQRVDVGFRCLKEQ